MDYETLKIKEYNYWGIYLYENQYYLGRCVVWCKRENVIDFFDMTQEEREEFFTITKNLRDTLRKLFHPDLMNYASLANVVRHLHLHVIPRYKDKRTFEGFEFNDERWGKNYTSYNEEFKLPEDLMFKIRDTIKENL